ncbi:MAG: phosphatase PAP2 family protein [Calditrichia bacterium]
MEQQSKFYCHYFKKFDCVFFSYIFVLIILVSIFNQNIENYFFHLVKYISILLVGFTVIPFLEKYKAIRMVHFLRYWYLPLSVTFLYWDVGNLIHLVFPELFDPIILKIEYAIFGQQYPNLLVEKIYNPILNEIMQISYATYWFTIPVSVGILYIRRKYDELEHLLALTFLTFFLCYIIFILFPVAGPRFYIADLFTKEYVGLLFTPFLRHIVQGAGLKGAAFPSSHVAVAIVILMYLWRIENKIAKAIFLPVVIMLSLATVYGRYHYFLDMMAGLIFGTILGFTYLKIIGNKLNSGT